MGRGPHGGSRPVFANVLVMKRIRVFASALVLGLVMAVVVPAAAQAADPVATVKATTQKMSGPGLPPNYKQNGTWAVGTKLTLSCYQRGQAVKGYYSKYFPGGWDDLWYKTKDGNWVADVDIDTKSNNPVTGQCPASGAPAAPAPAAGPATSIPVSGAPGAKIGIDPAAVFTITAKVSGLVLDIAGGVYKDQTAVQQFASNSTASQKFTFTPNGDGTYRISSALGSQQVLDVAGGATGDKTRVQTWKWSNVGQQKWIVVVSADPGYVTIKPSHASTKCLDVPGGSKTKVQLQIISCNDTASQQFMLTNLTPPPGRNAYAYPVRPNSTLTTYGGHNGDDFKASSGQAVYAMTGGVATVQSVTMKSKSAGGYCPNNVPINGKQNEIVIKTVIKGKEYVFRYAHLATMSVKSGDLIYPGQLIGTAGKTGCADGVHLHLDVTAGGAIVYPRDLLGTKTY